MKTRIITAATACLVSVSGLSLADPVVLGPLQIQHTATIHSDGAKLSLENTEYAYYSGDRLVTSDKGSAVLTLDGGFALFAPSTEAVVVRAQDAYQVALEAGGVRLGFRHNADFVIRVADITVAPFETSLIKAASGEATIDVAVSIKDGKPSVFVKNGRVKVTSKSSGQFQTVAAGEVYTATQSQAAVRPVAIGRGGSGTVDPIVYILLAGAAGMFLLDSGGPEGSQFRTPPQ
jgi:hypothetical protein